MKYDPKTNSATVLQSGITYPNGLAISGLVVALTGPWKLRRYGIKSPKTGTSEPLAGLPGYPDNVRADGKGGFWVALHREKLELPFGPDSYLLAVRINADGQIVQVMRGPKGIRPNEVVEREGGKQYMELSGTTLCRRS
ncbi:protein STRICTOSIDINE SYNTHASE-LIKE 10-like [Panicum virgatum]|uniref:protein STRICTOSIDINE SYNTHASE-LIKE 10-like n=1 Tax=Panicum virgatum TaxID=38727 RepID=UPI0019D4F5AA|nr:protein STRICTOSIDINE SYNTHASE-LIKE 10-like [Panicum virgatum]